MSFAKILKKIQLLILRLWKRRPFWLRGLLCWAIGLAFLWNHYSSNYDYRFKVRGHISNVQDIVVILLTESDWKKLRNVQIDTFESLRSLYVNETLTDNYFWDETVWTQILAKLLEYNPEKIGITFFFGSNIGNYSLNEYSSSIFRNPKIIWASRMSQEGQVQYPLFGRQRDSGVSNLYPDYDGLVRQYSVRFYTTSPLAQKLSANSSYETEEKFHYINFSSDPMLIPKIKILDVMQGKIPLAALKGKTIIIGAKDSLDHIHPTPVGFMTRAELTAQIVDNYNKVSFPFKLPIHVYAAYLLLVLIITLMIIYEYPQNYAIAILVCFGAITTELSVWIFDRYYIWSPIVATITEMLATYIIFVGYKLTQNERKSWRLEQEKNYLTQIEQLKNNFISLISHDLKTPIAKIQGIAGRLIQTSPSEEYSQDLRSIQNSSQDLHRYIQSILQVTRVESSDFKIKKDATDINQLIEKAQAQLHELAHDKHLEVILKLEPMFSIEVDSALIFEVIANLIENAIKYTPSGGSILVTSEEVDGFAIVQVSDTGNGIPKEEQDQVWEKFYRGKEHNLSTQGSGLGLYLVKYFVELHEGKVLLKSELGKGTTIGFKLPVQIEDNNG